MAFSSKVQRSKVNSSSFIPTKLMVTSFLLLSFDCCCDCMLMSRIVIIPGSIYLWKSINISLRWECSNSTRSSYSLLHRIKNPFCEGSSKTWWATLFVICIKFSFLLVPSASTSTINFSYKSKNTKQSLSFDQATFKFSLGF